MYAVIGDVVGSRLLADRAGAQQHLGAALASVNRELEAVQALGPTVGDEFQGAYRTLGQAVRAALLVRLAVLPTMDVRAGVGHGATTVFDSRRTPLLQDGPAWWSAREALTVLGAPRRAAARTWYVGPVADAVNAHLLCRDALVDRLTVRGWRMLRLALLGETQQRIAQHEGISKSAVSQQFGRGIGAVRDAQRLLDELQEEGA